MNFLRKLFGAARLACATERPIYASSKEHVILTIPSHEGIAMELKLLPAQARYMAQSLIRIADHVESQ